MQKAIVWVVAVSLLTAWTSLSMMSCSEETTVTEAADNSSAGNRTVASSVAQGVGNAPLSSIHAVYFRSGWDELHTGASTIPQYVKALVDRYSLPTGDAKKLPAGFEFPLANKTTDNVRAIPGLSHNTLVRWLDPLDQSNATNPPRFGANCDYISYFGNGWAGGDNTWAPGDPAPQFNGSDSAGWMWCNHEYVSGINPNVGTAPDNQMLTLANHIKATDTTFTITTASAAAWDQAHVDIFQMAARRQLGGSWFRIVQDSDTGVWSVDKTATARRYDATSNTLSKVTAHSTSEPDHTDTGAALPAGVVAGIMGDCSGGTTPWGTIITCEENVQDYYGDLEDCWSSSQLFTAPAHFAAGADVNPTFAPAATGLFSLHSDPNTRHNRDTVGYAVEVDPGQASDEYYGKTTAGVGHRKLGYMGRCRWENATFVTGTDWKLENGKPIVCYWGNDRRSGRIYKFVTTANYTAGMTKAQIRDTLDVGKLYVGHFTDIVNQGNGLTIGPAAAPVTPTEAAPGNGVWIHISASNTTQDAPNAGTAVGAEGTKVGAALQDVSWNGIGGFPDDNMVRNCLFTAESKLGIRELNRPEDMEWNPKAPLASGSTGKLLFIAFTNHTSGISCDNNGVLYTNDTGSNPRPTGGTEANRGDRPGAIFALKEAGDDPYTAMAFTFWQAARGNATAKTGAFDWGAVDNLMIDKDGGVWFGTDGNYGLNGTADALYYLDLKAGSPTRGKGFRVIAGPSDSEATGPCFSAGMKTIFFGAQHPGEGTGVASTWPQER